MKRKVGIVITCAGKKYDNVGSLPNKNGKPIKFVANPDAVTHKNDRYSYARPYDICDDRKRKWLDELIEYNEQVKNGSKKNEYGLLPACRLYRNPIYKDLADKVGSELVSKVDSEKVVLECVYIFSAGWGIIRYDFLTPPYDITYSEVNKQKHSYREKYADFKDYNMIPDDGKEIIFLGGKTYSYKYRDLIESYSGKKIVYYATNRQPELSRGFELRRYRTNASTNWYYACARDIIDGKLPI